MNFNDFTGEVQHRIDAGTQGEAVKTMRAVLTTLGERLPEGEASDFAAPLPMEIDRYLLEAESGRQFSYDEFVDRVGERADLEEADAAFASKAVVALAAEPAPRGELDDLKASLPDEFDGLFEFVGTAEAAEPW